LKYYYAWPAADFPKVARNIPTNGPMSRDTSRFGALTNVAMFGMLGEGEFAAAALMAANGESIGSVIPGRSDRTEL
jgi:hypothetical protein